MKPLFILLTALLLAGSAAAFAAQAGAAMPDFGTNVLVFDPAITNVQAKLDDIFRQQEKNQFGPARFACLFKPGNYHLDVQVGFDTQIVGLGKSPDDVDITGAVRVTAGWAHGNATCNFWRAIENLAITPALGGSNVEVWAVSQGTALRRVHVKGDLNLWDGGWSSGGFLADSKIDGQVNSGTQQQWLSRNAEFGRWTGSSWNMVFVGVVNPPTGTWPQPPYTVVEQTPVSREKPYLFVDDTGAFAVKVPDLVTNASIGTTWTRGETKGAVIPIDRFYLAHPGDTAATINAALQSGKHLLLTPGIYHLESSIQISRPGTVVLGLGYPTLVPDNGTPALVLADVDGIQVGGLLLEAGRSNSPTLLQVGGDSVTGNGKSDNVTAANPIFLYDIFARVGGAVKGESDCMVTINCNDVVGDNFWLWRADHGRGVGWTANKNRNGLVVNGDGVTVYGLFVEHCQQYQTLWNGNGGRVYFYQSEMPYDPPSAAAWSHDGGTGYASYKVADSVKTHEAWGLGIYCVFYDTPVVAANAVEAPEVPGVKIHHITTVKFNGMEASGIGHVINGRGGSTVTQKSATAN